MNMIEEFEYNGIAMGTDYSISIVCNNKGIANSLYEIAKDNISKYESRFSRFLPDSELSILNSKKKMVVSKEFLEVTLKARDLFNKTKGIFNPLVSISRLGYNKTFVDIENNKSVEDKGHYDINFNTTLINKQKSLIELNDGQSLDYGGFLKGYLAEKIAEQIQSFNLGIKGVIVNIGGDIHTKGLDKNGNIFIFNIYNPISKIGNILVPLYNQSLATSGTYKRSWLNSNKKVHHILDITGKKNVVSDIISASVIHKDGAKTEAYTKVFLSMDYQEALKFLEEDDLSFVLIKNNGEVIKT